MVEEKEKVEEEEKKIEETAGEKEEVEEKIEKNEEEMLKKIKKEKKAEKIASWAPRTKAGKLVKEGKIKNIDEVLENYRILELEIVDSLLDLKSELLNVGQSKGKFGGGKRRVWRQTQKKTAEGNVPTFSCLAVVGDEAGHVGMGIGKAKETLPAREKALREAKINVIKINRGCGSFDCSCNELHSLPFRVEGKSGSLRVILIPAPQGTGLVIGDECKKILKLAGIKDVYSKTFGQTRTTVNLAKACMNALKKTCEENLR